MEFEDLGMKKIICKDRGCIHNDSYDDSCSFIRGKHKKIIIKSGKCRSKVKGK